jgi:dTDP-4-dehydrorhamnose reductase
MKAGKALVLGGKGGLLGRSLAEALNSAGWKVESTGRPEQDHFKQQGLLELIDRCAPDAIFNTWAYTQVDRAEEEDKEAQKVNRDLPRLLGRIASNRTFRVVHYSTDFIFDGKKHSPYSEDDPPSPLSVYGRTKLSGEAALIETCPSAHLLIIRSAWLFGPGKDNFVSKICRLAAERDEIGVVHDQIGSPTYTPDLARNTLELLRKKATGIYHVVNSGEASWCELAAEAIRSAGIQCEIKALKSDQYPQQANRPTFSVLATRKFTRLTGVSPRPWVQAVRDYVYSELLPDGA